MKALIGLAAAAILGLTAGGIKAALPEVQTGPEPAEGKTSQVRAGARPRGVVRRGHRRCPRR
ncbi:hypothetical protein H5V45_20410 [Nocardioides sp. KIGAM211]|uniref:Uncharacterized protein n=1 Tax=Nocardioides luti TaxID=2761101 RepID=A0A7X0RMJ4_9ACTN|nr:MULTISPECIES: hypothetical protein [Nocardioides]KQY62241.1 hypothetical protein ASD30_24775 [Nocardioides sp. Root140]KRF20839.1 hypothetical protein ASH02_00540 [Nocardioides sp. Soil796]MBB6629693.1 hypothetical protein [Nocardioides luti]MCX6405622.1 hypothetical protein [Propionibacteriales bacterium]